MPVNMIERKDRIVLHYQNERVGPKAGVGNRLDDSPQCEVVIGHGRTRCRHAWRRASSVIAWQKQN